MTTKHGRQRAYQIVAAVTALAFAAVGCGYQSSYVAPIDGRARVVWNSSDPAIELAGAAPSGLCREELDRAIDQSRSHPVATSASHVAINVSMAPGEYWVPRYYGPQIIVVRPGWAPFFPRPPVFFPSVIRPGVAPTRIISGGGRISGGGSFNFSGGGGKGGEALLIILVVITVSILPAISLGLAASTPESASRSAAAIDFVNAYNDYARTSGTPCTPAPPSGVELTAPPEQPR